MNKLHAVAAVVVALLLSASAPRAGDTTGRAGQLQGEWRVLSTADENRTDAGSAGLTMTIRADGRAVFKVGGLVTNEGVLKPGRSGKNRVIDLKLADGQTLLGVYELRGNTLVICFGEAGKGRPAGIVPRDSQWVETWGRVERAASPARAARRPRDAGTPTGRKLWERP